MIEKDYFKYYKINFDSLNDYGFKKVNEGYLYSTQIVDNLFRMEILINKQHEIITKVIDLSSEEEYVLHLLKKAKGSFASKVKEAYNDVLDDFRSHCMVKEVYQTNQAKSVFNYFLNHYQINPEYLFKKDDITAVFRHPTSNKWIGIMMIVSKNRLGDYEDKPVEIMNLKTTKEKMNEILKLKGYYPGYHMNKKYWFSVCLNEVEDLNKLYQLIEKSYQLVK